MPIPASNDSSSFDPTADATAATATVLLADSAQVANRKLYLLGGGWDHIKATPFTSPFSVIVLAELPWSLAGSLLPWSLDLTDMDGHPVTAPGDTKPLVSVSGEISAQEATVNDLTAPIPLAINVPPLPLAPNRYTWRFSLNDHPVASRTFTVSAG